MIERRKVGGGRVVEGDDLAAGAELMNFAHDLRPGSIAEKLPESGPCIGCLAVSKRVSWRGCCLRSETSPSSDASRLIRKPFACGRLSALRSVAPRPVTQHGSLTRPPVITTSMDPRSPEGSETLGLDMEPGQLGCLEPVVLLPSVFVGFEGDRVRAMSTAGEVGRKVLTTPADDTHLPAGRPEADEDVLITLDIAVQAGDELVVGQRQAGKIQDPVLRGIPDKGGHEGRTSLFRSR
jgi:hypothetical protein